MLIARVIAEPSGLETRLDEALQTLANSGMPVASAGLLHHGGDVVQLEMPDGDRQQALARLADGIRQGRHAGRRPRHRIPRLFVSDMDSTMIGAGMHR